MLSGGQIHALPLRLALNRVLSRPRGRRLGVRVSLILQSLFQPLEMVCPQTGGLASSFAKYVTKDKPPLPLPPRHWLAYLCAGDRMFWEPGDDFFPESQFLEMSDEVAKEGMLCSAPPQTTSELQRNSSRSGEPPEH